MAVNVPSSARWLIAYLYECTLLVDVEPTVVVFAGHARHSPPVPLDAAVAVVVLWHGARPVGRRFWAHRDRERLAVLVPEHLAVRPGDVNTQLRPIFAARGIAQHVFRNRWEVAFDRARNAEPSRTGHDQGEAAQRDELRPDHRTNLGEDDESV